MTTITALNVRLGMDVSNFSEGANLAKAETNRVATIMRQSVPAADKYRQELDLLNRTFSESGKQSKQYADAVAFLQKKYQAVIPDAKQANRAIAETSTVASSAMQSVKRLAAAYLGIQTVAKSIKLATEVEDATVAFEVLTGSVKDGQRLFEQIREFSDRSPITFSGAAQATRTMMSFGIAAEDVRQNLQMISDVTGGNNERFKTLSLAFSQMSAAGRLMGQDLLQMINAGFNPLQQISKTTGESLIDLKKRMEAGGISADEVRRAFVDATSEGGMFHGMTERLAETMGGKLNIALSNLEKALAAAGEAIAPLVIAMTDGFDKGQSVMDGVLWTIEKISEGLQAVIALTKDLFNLDLEMTAFNKMLDDMAKRDADRIKLKNLAKDEFEKKKEAAKEAAAKIEEIDKKAIEKAHKERLKAIEAEAKAQQRAADEFQRELERARGEAMRFFEERQRRNQQMREDVSRGPGAGMEAGSVDAAKFFADTVNRQIGAAAVPEEKVLQKDIAKKTAELLIAQREANAKAQIQIELAERQLAEMQQNGFRRIR